MSAAFIGTSVGLFIFALGFMTGNGYTTRSQNARDRRQAAVQRDLNAQWRSLRYLQEEAAEEELCWLSKQQSGLVVIDYDNTKEVPSKDQKPPLRPSRPVRWR